MESENNSSLPYAGNLTSGLASGLTGGSVDGIYSGEITGITTSTYTVPRPWKFCPECAQKLEATWRYCAGCGNAVNPASQYGYHWTIPYYPYGCYPYSQLIGGAWTAGGAPTSHSTARPCPSPGMIQTPPPTIKENGDVMVGCQIIGNVKHAGWQSH